MVLWLTNRTECGMIVGMKSIGSESARVSKNGKKSIGGNFMSKLNVDQKTIKDLFQDKRSVFLFLTISGLMHGVKQSVADLMG